MAATRDLLDEIRAGASALGIAPTTLCQKAVRHGGLVRRLERGGRVTLETAEQIRSFIRAAKKRKPVIVAEHEQAAS
jgi:hypothetical protein